MLVRFELAEEEMFIYDKEISQMIKKKVKFVPGLYKLYDEGLVNMRDHAVRMADYIDKQSKILAKLLPPDPKIELERKYRPVKNMEITVDVSNDLITFKNDGDGIDVAWHNKENMYVPELIFGTLLSGTNFDDNEERIVGGQNGYGAKLINVLSTEFTIETVDAHRGLKYIQRFSKNMSLREEPVISKYRGVPYTQISFKPDLPRFGLQHLSDSDTVQIMYKRAYDLAACFLLMLMSIIMGKNWGSRHLNDMLIYTLELEVNVNASIRSLIPIGKWRSVPVLIIHLNMSLLLMGFGPSKEANMWIMPPTLSQDAYRNMPSKIKKG